MSVDKIREEIAKLWDEYVKKYGENWEVRELDALCDWFEDAKKLIESVGGKVIEKYVAPNGYISFEYNGEIWTADLSYGLFKG